VLGCGKIQTLKKNRTLSEREKETKFLLTRLKRIESFVKLLRCFYDIISAWSNNNRLQVLIRILFVWEGGPKITGTIF